MIKQGVKSWFSSINILNELKNVQTQFMESHIMERILPRKFETEEDLRRITDDLQYTQRDNDLHGLTNGLSKPIYDLLDRGGKRWRPALCFFSSECFGHSWSDTIEIAGFCELIHNGTLIVDDVEDSRQKIMKIYKNLSLQRRKQPCVHLKYGIDVALNAGNFLYFVPFQFLLNCDKFSEGQKLRMAKVAIKEMTAVHLGQAWDINWHNMQNLEGNIPSEVQYLQMTAHKTGVLVRLAMRLIGIQFNFDDSLSESLARFAEQIGIAFQIQDDIINIESEEYKDTKGYLGEDIYEGKLTLMVIHCLNKVEQKERNRLFEILRMKTKDEMMIKEVE